MWNEMGNLHWGWMGLGAVHMVLFWGFLILAIVVLVRFASGGQDEKREDIPESALEILKARYARGEIDRNEFEQKKRDLQD